jgi:Holliday junction resolvase
VDKKVKEKWVKQQVVKLLKDRGAYYFYPVASGYMSSGVPDIVACYRGAFMGIECKAGDNKPSVLQEKNLKQIRDNEGVAMVVNEDNLIAFQDFLKHMEEWK